jgi:hypothetical protein
MEIVDKYTQDLAVMDVEYKPKDCGKQKDGEEKENKS